eukprot:677180-Amorphochlora_amoeboformis.AAC.1
MDRRRSNNPKPYSNPNRNPNPNPNPNPKSPLRPLPANQQHQRVESMPPLGRIRIRFNLIRILPKLT